VSSPNPLIRVDCLENFMREMTPIVDGKENIS